MQPTNLLKWLGIVTASLLLAFVPATRVQDHIAKNSSPISFIPTILTQDTFHRANESPINPAAWFEVGGGLPAVDQLCIVNDVCTTTTSVQADGTVVNQAIAWPNDQFGQVRLIRLSANGVVFLYLRAGATTDAPCYRLIVGGPFRSSAGFYTIDQVSSDGGSVVYTWVDTQAISLVANDTIDFYVKGTKANGGQLGFVLIHSDGVRRTVATANLSDSPIGIDSGSFGMQLASVSVPPSQNDVGIDHFAGGSL